MNTIKIINMTLISIGTGLFILSLIFLPAITTYTNINNINPLTQYDNLRGYDKFTFYLTQHNQSTQQALYMAVNGWLPDKLSGTITYTAVSYNKVTNVGAKFLVDNLFGTSGITTLVANYIGVSQDTTTPAYTDTSCTNEATIFGLVRSIGAYSSNVAASGSVVATLQTTFTALGTYSNINKVCIWTGIYGTGATLFSTALMPNIPVNMGNTDTLKVVYQPTLSY